MNVAILGASQNPDRLAHLAQSRLMELGHQVFPINPRYEDVLGVKTYASLSEIDDSIDTVTIYLEPNKSEPLLKEMLELKPKRIIFNPGSESNFLQPYLMAEDILVMNACTLVMMNAGTF